jgi:hypothetical protein
MHGHQHKKIAKAPNSKLKTLDSDPSNNYSNPYDFRAQNLMGIEKNMRKGYGLPYKRPTAGNPTLASPFLHHSLSPNPRSDLLKTRPAAVLLAWRTEEETEKKEKEKKRERGEEQLLRGKKEEEKRRKNKRRGKNVRGG